MVSLEAAMQKLLEDINRQGKEATNLQFSSEVEIVLHLQKEFPDVTPSLDELFIGRCEAYKRAAIRITEEKKEKKKAEKLHQVMKPWTAEEMYNVAVDRGNLIAERENFRNGFVIDEYNREVFKLLCLYFTNDPEFEKHGIGGINYSLNKGIWLQSSIRGSGKSTLLKCFQHNKRSCFGYLHTAQLGNMYQKGGFDKIDPYIGTMPQPASVLNFYQTECGFMYDELFGETKFSFMGTPLVPSEYIINRLYDFPQNFKGKMWKFHCTSNATGEDIEQTSGMTYRTRMPDMFNLIKLEGINRRII